MVPHARISSTMPRTSCKKHDIKLVRLLKKQDQGLGMVVTCGNTYETVLHGAFVEAVTPGGVVDLEGNISPGDQILSVNGTDVRSMNFLEVVDLLKHSNSPIELVVEKLTKNQFCPTYPQKEVIEPSFSKTESWITGSIHSKDTMVIDQKNNDGNFCEEDAPIPKPRKKWIEREKISLNYPDLTLNHATVSNLNTSWRTEDCSDINEYSNIPDIIPSRVKCKAEMEESHQDMNKKQNGSLLRFPGELYHVVLDKKGGSLGLNIYQGIEPFCPLQRNIYIHSTIPGGAAELNGKISSGDKLLKVNGISLENLSYQEVVSKLRETSQVVHLVLERRCFTSDETDEITKDCDAEQYSKNCNNNYLPMASKIQNGTSANSPSVLITEPQVNNGIPFSQEQYVPMSLKSLNSSSTNSTIILNGTDVNKTDALKQDLISANCTDSQKLIADIEHCEDPEDSLNCSLENSLQNSISFESSKHDESLNSSSILSSIHDLSNADANAKEFNSAPTSYQHVNGNSKQCKKSNSDLDSPEITNQVNGISTSPNTKGQNLKKKYRHCAPQNELTSYKSTPNLADNSDDEETGPNGESSLHRNSRSTDCLYSSPYFLNPHLALMDLYHNYTFVRSSSTDINQLPKVPIRKKKLRKLEDVYNFCNNENTFTVDVRKSSRGLGISISGGRELESKDSFSQLIRIRKLYPLQPALECGKLQLGDVILEVNGTSMLGLSNTEALDILRCTPSDVVLKIFRPSKSLIPSFSTYKDGSWPFSDSSSSSASSSLSRCETKAYNLETGDFEITLMKREGSLGFTILQHAENVVDNTPAGIYIKALIREPAVSDGRIHPGDRILKVNGVPISSMTHMEAIAFIRKAPNTVVLNLHRMDPPLSPGSLEEDYTITKPLRWEAVELINDRGKEKDNAEDTNTLKRKLKRKLERPSHAPSDSSAMSESSSSTSSGQEYVINENEDTENTVSEDAKDTIDEDTSELLEDGTEDLLEDCPGLQRNQRPKSLDVLNSSDRKRLNGHVSEDSFHRQASVMCSVAETKGKNNEIDGNTANSPSKTGGEGLLKWRGSTMPDSEEVNGSNLVSMTAYDSSLNSCDEQNSDQVDSMVQEEDEEAPVPMPRTTSAVSNDWVETFMVILDRGWHGRLGFSLYDAPPPPDDSPKKLLPAAVEVKAVYPGSLADKDGRIKVGDRLIEVNQESLLEKSAIQVIDILRKTRGFIKLVLCRLKSDS